MDIVKRAYLQVYKAIGKDSPHIVVFHEAVAEEIKRLIRVRAYSGRDWPREFGPYPDELRANKAHHKTRTKA